MTIRLLVAWGGYPCNAIVTLDAPTETLLISGKYAVSNLTDGQVYVKPNQPESIDETHVLAPGSDGNGRTISGVNAYIDPLSGGLSLLSAAGVRLPTVLYQNYAGIQHTGILSETILASILIPAGTIIAPAMIEQMTRTEWSTTSTAGNRSLKFGLNTSNSLSGITPMGSSIFNTVSVTNSFSRPADSVVFPTNTSQLGYPGGSGFNSTTSGQTDLVGSRATTADMYWIVSAILADVADVLKLRALRLTMF